jgi:hypothetical protein
VLIAAVPFHHAETWSPALWAKDEAPT